MKKEELNNSVLLLAEYGLKDKKVYNYLLKNDSIPEVIKKLVYDLFVNEFNNNCIFKDEVNKAYRLVLNYSKELSEKGFVDFD